jgi:N-methylhydantoinase A
MQIPLLVIPSSPGTTSALGLLATDVKHDFSRTRIMKGDRLNVEEVNIIFTSMEKEGKALLTHEGIDAKNMSFLREIETRYVGQSYELGIVCPNGPLELEDLHQICDRFHPEHERAYGRGYPEELVEFVNFRLTAIGAIARPPLRRISSNGHNLGQASKGSRPVFFAEVGKYTDAEIYDRYRLVPGQRLLGPAVVEEMDSHTVLHPDFQADVDPFGNLLISPRK